jgi:MFS family permease
MPRFSAAILRSLRHRNYRLWFFGQLVSLHGTWMQTTAQYWLLYRLTESGFMLGLAGTLTLLPNLLFSFLGGALADRVPKRGLLIGVKILALLQAVALGVLTLGGWIQPWHILGLALVLGLVQALEMPVRQSFVAEMVARPELANAIGLNSSLFHLARFFGPAVAGILIARFGEGPVFLINAVSFLAVIGALAAMHIAPGTQREGEGRARGGIFAGWHYARDHSPIRLTLAMIAAVSFFGGAATVLLPIFTSKVFDRGAEGLGLLMAMLGAGALAGALALARRPDADRLEQRVAATGVLVGAGWLIFARLDLYWLAMPALLVIGFAATSVYASGNALIQLSVPDALRGRVMALFTIALHGMVSLGQLVLGTAADLLGVQPTVTVSAVVLIGLALWVRWRLRRSGQALGVRP